MITVKNDAGHIVFGAVVGDLPILRREAFQILVSMDKLLQTYGAPDVTVEWFRRAVRDYLEAPEVYGCIEGPKEGGKHAKI